MAMCLAIIISVPSVECRDGGSGRISIRTMKRIMVCNRMMLMKVLKLRMCSTVMDNTYGSNQLIITIHQDANYSVIIG